MANAPSSIEILPAPPGRLSGDISRRRRPALVFLLTFILCAALGLGYTFLRQPVYRSTATLLIAPQHSFNQVDEAARAQFVAVQRQLLTSRALLAQLPVEDNPRRVFSVEPVDDTWMLELRATGHDRPRLPELIEAWIGAYQSHYAAARSREDDSAGEALGRQLTQLDQRVADKRRQIQTFQQRYAIVSQEREENQVTARIKALNDSLNQARNAQATAQGRLESLREALNRGEDIGRPEDLRSLDRLEVEAGRIGNELRELSRRFTQAYMELDPAIVAKTERLAELERRMDYLRQATRQRVLAEAGQETAAARRTVAALERELADYQHTAQAFSARFREYQALQEELAQLEQLHRQAQQRLVNEEVVQPDQTPRITVLDRSGLAWEPLYPDYRRDTWISLAAALGGALLVLLLYRQRPLPEADQAASQRPSLFAVLDPRLLGQGPRNEPDPLTAGRERVALPSASPRELSRDEAEFLLEVAGPEGQRLVAVLL
ncbi:MAG: Wzz/FepE/Etk N-terminal domain-containing protein, partial [Candidatus Competibacteraceae bacterium]|nr:Wzz/FepE/Etk N-terminal domain-containing protein [Candidatus Competibacteraceae bacterium]